MRRVLVVVAALVVAAAGLVGWRVLAASSFASVVCRAPDAPFSERHLSAGMVHDLRSHDPEVSPEDLRTPTMSQIGELGEARTGSTPMTVCATRDRDRLLMFTRYHVPRERCYGICAGFTSTMFWETCYDTFYVDSHRHGPPSGCATTER